jgi:hypothetical protein
MVVNSRMDKDQVLALYQSILNELQTFKNTLGGAQTRNQAETNHEQFLNDIRPRILDLQRRNQQLAEADRLTAAQLRRIDELEGEIFAKINEEFPGANDPIENNNGNAGGNGGGLGVAAAAAGGGRRRKARKGRKSRRNRKGRKGRQSRKGHAQ